MLRRRALVLSLCLLPAGCSSSETPNADTGAVEASDGGVSSGEGSSSGDASSDSGDGSNEDGGDGDEATTGDGDSTSSADESTGSGDGDEADTSGGDGDTDAGGDGDSSGDGDSGADGDSTGGDGDSTGGDGDGDCHQCDAEGDTQCDPNDISLIQVCETNSATNCREWVPQTDCTVEMSDPDGFCNGTVAPVACDVPEPCATENPMVTFEPPIMLMLLDHSGSMYLNDIGPGVTRWDGLVQVVDTVTQQYQGQIEFGIKWFPSSTTECTTTSGKCDVTDTFDVLPDLDNNMDIMTALNAMQNLGSCSTPTQEAMEKSLIAMNNFVPAGRVGAIMLIIDGGVATFCSGNTQSGTVAAVTSALNDGYNTYVVGIDAGTSAEANEYAQAGGVPNPSPGNDYYPGENLTDLNDALDLIASDLVTCDIQLSVAAVTPGLTDVIVDGVEYEQIDPGLCGSADGWYYTDSSFLEITLCGQACEDFKDVATAQVEYYCISE